MEPTPDWRCRWGVASAVGTLCSPVAPLACIAHKSLEICERCRLWQRNSPAAPENSAAFGVKSFKTVCFDSFILKQALNQTRSVCLRTF